MSLMKYMEHINPILSMREHRKRNNRDSTLFITTISSVATSPKAAERDSTIKESKLKDESNGIYLPSGINPSDLDRELT